MHQRAYGLVYTTEGEGTEGGVQGATFLTKIQGIVPRAAVLFNDERRYGYVRVRARFAVGGEIACNAVLAVGSFLDGLYGLR